MKRVAIFPPVDNPFMRQMVAGFAHGFEMLGCETHHGFELLLPDDLNRFAREYKPDLILEINRSREMAQLEDPGIAHVCWIQDYWIEGRRRITDGLSGSELFYTIITPDNLSIDVLPDNFAGILPAGIDPRFFHRTDSARVVDAMFAGHMPATLSMMQFPDISLANGNKRISIHELEAALLNSSEIRHASSSPQDVLAFVNGIIRGHLGHNYSFAQFEAMHQPLSILFQIELPRVMGRKWLAEATLAATPSLALFGPETWAHWPRFAPHYCGMLRTCEDIANAHHRSRVSLHNGALSMHSRVLEGMGCGSIMLVNATPYDSLDGGMHRAFEPGQHYVEYREDDYTEILARTLRDEPGMESMRRNAAAAIAEGHLWKHRAERILSDLGARWRARVAAKPAQSVNPRPAHEFRFLAPKILLVVPRTTSADGDHYEFPVDEARLAAALKAAGTALECLDLNRFPAGHLHILADKVIDFAPDIVICGVCAEHFDSLAEICHTVLLFNPETLIIATGAAISGAPEIAMDALGVDLGITGAEEKTLFRLLDAWASGQPWSEIPGIAYRTHCGQVFRTTAPAEAEPLDQLPWPDYEAFGLADYLGRRISTDDPALGSLGLARAIGVRYGAPGTESRPIYSRQRFFSELDRLIQNYRPDLIRILDAPLTRDKDCLFEFAESMQALGINWLAHLPVELVAPDTLAELRAAGCIQIRLCPDPAHVPPGEQAAALRRIEQALALGRQHGLGIRCNLGFGHAKENDVALLEKLEWWTRNRRYGVRLSPIRHLPGTANFRNAISLGAIPDPLEFVRKGCPVVNATRISGYETLISGIDFLQKVITYPAILLSWRADGAEDADGRRTYSASCICPHCSHPDAHTGLTGRSGGGHAFRVACRTCMQPYDVPAPPPTADSLSDKLFWMAARQYKEIGIEQAMKTLSFILGRDKTHANTYFLMGEIKFALGDSAQGIRLMREALLLEPFNAHFHQTFGRMMERTLPLLAPIYANHSRQLSNLQALGTSLEAAAPAALS